MRDGAFLDMIQSDVLLGEFDNILTIKRGKMMSSLKIEKIYSKIHMIEEIVDNCTNADQSLTLEQLQEFALNLGALQMVNFLPHMDLIPVQTQNRINLLMNSAQRELIKQFEEKASDYRAKAEKTDWALSELKTKEMALLETTAELNYAKSALKSGEVKELLQKLPGLLMDTSQKTLMKQEEAKVLQEQKQQHAKKVRRNASRSKNNSR